MPMPSKTGTKIRLSTSSRMPIRPHRPRVQSVPSTTGRTARTAARRRPLNDTMTTPAMTRSATTARRLRSKAAIRLSSAPTADADATATPGATRSSSATRSAGGPSGQRPRGARTYTAAHTPSGPSRTSSSSQPGHRSRGGTGSTRPSTRPRSRSRAGRKALGAIPAASRSVSKRSSAAPRPSSRSASRRSWLVRASGSQASGEVTDPAPPSSDRNAAATAAARSRASSRLAPCTITRVVSRPTSKCSSSWCSASSVGWLVGRRPRTSASNVSLGTPARVTKVTTAATLSTTRERRSANPTAASTPRPSARQAGPSQPGRRPRACITSRAAPRDAVAARIAVMPNATVTPISRIGRRWAAASTAKPAAVVAAELRMPGPTVRYVAAKASAGSRPSAMKRAKRAPPWIQ